MDPICFVIMGFGVKTDFATGRTLDLDKTYKNIIKPAVEAAGYKCIRADEIQHSGVIDVPMYDMLFSADLVVADLSTSNLNAVFELGVRHALKRRATIIMAEKQFKLPFDTNHISTIPYEHLGTDIGFDEVMRVRGVLQKLAETLKQSVASDSPVYVALADLQPPIRLVSKAPPPASQIAAAQDSYAAKLAVATEAKQAGDFDLAAKVLQQIYREQIKPGAEGTPAQPSPRITRELALATYKAGEKAAKAAGDNAIALKAYDEATTLLSTLNVDSTTDPETLGLWSAIYKRRAEMDGRTEEQKRQDLDEAVAAAERGFLIKRDYYTGTNLAYLLTFRASLSTGDDRIADRVWADRIRRQVVEITAKRLETLKAARAPAPGDGVDTTSLEEETYWTAASHAESLVALGDAAGQALLQQVTASAPATWMAESTMTQLGKLKALLAKP